MKPAQKQNLLIYSIMLAFTVAGILYGRSILAAYPTIRLWDFSVVLMLFLGVPFLLLQEKAGVPDFLSRHITTSKRLTVPALIGVAFGILDVLVIKVLLHPEPYTSLPPFLQPFPYSIFLYFSGALDVEVFYRLIPMTLFLLLGKYFLKGKYHHSFFWAGAILTALREPIEQIPDGNTWFIVYSLLTGFGMNLLQAIYFKHAGFLASLSVRLGHYLIWHILLGIYVQYVELS